MCLSLGAQMRGPVGLADEVSMAAVASLSEVGQVLANTAPASGGSVIHRSRGKRGSPTR